MSTTKTPEVVDYAEIEIDSDYIDAMDMVVEEDHYLTDDDYITGWNMTRAEVLGFENYDACYSTFDENDYEYLQGLN